MRQSKPCASTVEKKRSYSELLELPTLEERFEYLKIGGTVGESTFGSKRTINQLLYHSDQWLETRRKIILRDNGCEMGIPDNIITKQLTVHHMNPITLDDILNENDCVFDPDNLICVSTKLHRAIHYANEYEFDTFCERRPFDTCPWREV